MWRFGRKKPDVAEQESRAYNVKDMLISGAALADHPSDLIRLDVFGYGVIDLYNEAKLIEYIWMFRAGTFTVAFETVKDHAVIEIQFHGIRNIVGQEDPGNLLDPSCIEFIRFVFGAEYLDQGTADQRNVEFSTNLVDYRFWADSMAVKVRSDKCLSGSDASVESE